MRGPWTLKDITGPPLFWALFFVLVKVGQVHPVWAFFWAVGIYAGAWGAIDELRRAWRALRRPRRSARRK